MREDLYEQCSFHIAEKMPSSVKVGVLPIRLRIRSYSSGLRPWDATSSGVIGGSLGIMVLGGDVSLFLSSIKRTGKAVFPRLFNNWPNSPGSSRQSRSEERRVGKSVDLGGRRIIK